MRKNKSIKSTRIFVFIVFKEKYYTGTVSQYNITKNQFYFERIGKNMYTKIFQLHTRQNIIEAVFQQSFHKEVGYLISFL